MENSENIQKQTPWGIIAIIVVIILAIVVWQYMGKDEAPLVIEPVVEITPVAVETEEEPIIEEVVAQIEVIEPAPQIEVEPVKPLPTLNESDSWVQEKLPSLTWRKELLKLVVNDDMIRRFVVFTDNFSKGVIAYEHSPFVKPVASFSAKEFRDTENKGQAAWQWDESATRRFSLYVDLLRSIDTDTLMVWYIEVKPLIDEAYQELGYPDANFTETLQDAIIRVLDTQIPKSALSLTRPSVMYKFSDEELEGRDDADKLLLRLGRENLLVIKSILLEINEKLSRVDA